jgi:hypothetical protein
MSTGEGCITSGSPDRIGSKLFGWRRDCPSGCTEWSGYNYRISKGGTVIDLASSTQMTRNYRIGARLIGPKARYDLLGRNLVKQTNGVFVESQNNFTKKLLIYDNQLKHR